MPVELRPTQALRLWHDVTLDLVRDGDLVDAQVEVVPALIRAHHRIEPDRIEVDDANLVAIAGKRRNNRVAHRRAETLRNGMSEDNQCLHDFSPSRWPPRRLETAPCRPDRRNRSYRRRSVN